MNCLSCGAVVSSGTASCPTCNTPVRVPVAAAYTQLIEDRTAQFAGREWVFRTLDDWLAPGGSPTLLLTGKPGTGKTAIAGRLVQMSQGSVPSQGYPRLGRGSLAFVHFCLAADPTSRDPRRFVEGLSTSLARLFQPFARALIHTPSTHIVVNQSFGRAETGSQVAGVRIDTVEVGRLPATVAFDEAVRKPLEQLCGSDFDDTIVILVDSLDEAWGYDPEDNIATLLGQATALPRQIRLLLTARDDEEVLHAVPVPRVDLVADARQQEDIQAFAHDSERLKPLPEPRRTHLARRIAQAAAGDFLYARYVLRALPPDIDKVEDLSTLPLPTDLQDIYAQFLQHRLAPTLKQWGRNRPLLGVLAVARALGLSRVQLAGIMEHFKELAEDETSDLLQACSQFLAGQPPEGPFRIYHHSFRDFLLKDATYQVYPAQANQAVAEYFVAVYGEDWPTCQDDYAVRYTEDHLEEARALLSRPEQRLLRQKVEAELEALRGDRGYRLVRSIKSGRAWLLREVNAWLAADSRVLLITGEPGSGKTTLARWLADISEGKASVDAHAYPYIGPGFLAYAHHCQARDLPSVDPRSFTVALSRQFASRYLAFANALIATNQEIDIQVTQNVHAEEGARVTDAVIQSLDIGRFSLRTAFDRAVRRPLAEFFAAGLNEPVVVLVDGLDEALVYPGSDNVAHLVSDPDKWPGRVRFLVTSRADQRILRWFGEQARHLDLVDDAPPTITDEVAASVYSRLKELGLPGPRRVELAYRVAEASEANFLFAACVADDLLHTGIDADRLEHLPDVFAMPSGLPDVYYNSLRRVVQSDLIAWRERYQPLLGLLAVAFSPGLTATQLASIAGLTMSVTRDTLSALTQFLAGGWPEGPFRLFHESFRQWLFTTHREFLVSPTYAHRDIGTYYLEAYRGKWDRADDYAVEHAPAHLTAAAQGRGEWTARRQLHTLIELLTDPTFVDEKTRRFGTDALQADLKAAASLPNLPGEDRERLSAGAADLAGGTDAPAGARTGAGESRDWDEPLATV